MTLSRRFAVASATIAVAIGGATPALGSSMMTKWSTKQCKAYVKKWDKSMGMARTDYNKTLKEHSCKQRIT